MVAEGAALAGRGASDGVSEAGAGSTVARAASNSIPVSVVVGSELVLSGGEDAAFARLLDAA